MTSTYDENGNRRNKKIKYRKKTLFILYSL